MQHSNLFRLLAATALSAASIAAQASPVSRLADLMYQDMGWASGQLMRRGYHVSSRAEDGVQYWWGEADRACARITVDRHKQVSDLQDASKRDCEGEGQARDVARSEGHHFHESGRERHGREDAGSIPAPVAVYDLQGIRAASGERELAHRGFESIDGHGAFSTWWNGRARECVQVSTSGGYYQEVNVVSPSLCR